VSSSVLPLHEASEKGYVPRPALLLAVELSALHPGLMQERGGDREGRCRPVPPPLLGISHHFLGAPYSTSLSAPPTPAPAGRGTRAGAGVRGRMAMWDARAAAAGPRAESRRLSAIVSSIFHLV
jgi:hypothetical protein